MPKRDTKLEALKRVIGMHSIDYEMIDPSAIEELLEELNGLSDQRYQPNVRHVFGEVILIALFALFANCDQWTEIEIFAVKKEAWLRKYLTLPNGLPSHDTIQRVVGLFDSKQLEPLIVGFLIEKMDKLFASMGEDTPYIDDELQITDIQALDGKELKGSSRTSSKSGAIKRLSTLNIYSTEYGMCLSTDQIEEKSNEIPMAQAALSKMDLKGIIITNDALNTQKETIHTIKEQKGDYVVALKKNHKLFYQEVVDYFDADKLKELEESKVGYYKTIEKVNSKIITREFYKTNDVKWNVETDKWNGLKAFGLEVKTTENLITGESTQVCRHYIVSFKDNIELFALAVRRHWHIENKLHWHLDFTLKEDYNTTSEKNSARNLNILRKVVLAILGYVKEVYKRSLRGIRLMIGLDFENEIETVFKYLSIDNLKDLIPH